jgi:hypothetical protein
MIGTRQTKWWGLLRRKERWGLTPLSWSILLLALVGIVFWGSAAIYPFLAMTEPVEADALVVEGWLPDYALIGAANEFHSHPYHCLITTGGPVDIGESFAGYKTYAALSAATLSRLGVDSTKIIAVPSPRLKVNRTFASAISLSRWLKISGAKVHSLNLYSLGVHTRRSRLLFQRALGNTVPVGSIAAQDFSFNPDRWWRYSSGVEAVIFESVGYFYVKVLFPFSAEHAFSAE